MKHCEEEDVWVQPYPANGAKFQISTNGGTALRWRSDGKEIYFVSADQKLMAVPITLGPSPQWGAATELFDLPFSANNAAAWPYAPAALHERTEIFGARLGGRPRSDTHHDRNQLA